MAPLRTSWSTSGLSAALLLGILQAACASGLKPGETPPILPKDTEVRHESCAVDASSAERLDANADGKADVTIVRDGPRELCRAIDLNFDGSADSWIYFDGAGTVRRRESDYDRDGRVDEISVFQSGALIEKQRATMLTNRLDTWEFYKGGKLARTERDSNGDRVVDQWWEYTTPGCPVIHADVNSDGRPDPGASVDYCKETGYVPPERQDFKQADSPNFQQTGGVPTELDSKEQTGGAPAPPAPGGASAPPPAPPAKPVEKQGGGK